MPSKSTDSWHPSEFERWFDVNPFLPGGERILVVGRYRPARRTIVLIAVDEGGGLVILEIRGEPTNRRAIAAALEYLALHEGVSMDALLGDDEGAANALRDAYQATFGKSAPALTARRRVLLVAPAHDVYAGACGGYLSRHLTGGEITFRLLTATKSAAGFALREPAAPTLHDVAVLGRTFAASIRGEVFYVLEPGGTPVGWKVGKLAAGGGALVADDKPSRRAVRILRQRVVPLRHPESVDLSHSSTIWIQRDRPDRAGRVLGVVSAGGAGRKEENQVVFAAFRGEEFRAIRRRPAAEFFSRWIPSDRQLPDWRAIAKLARDRAEARR